MIFNHGQAKCEWLNISQSGTHQFATRKTAIRNKERTDPRKERTC